MRRAVVFVVLLLVLAGIDSAAPALLHQPSSASPAALFARGIACMVAGYALTRAPTDAIVAALLAILASFLSLLALSDFGVIVGGAAVVFMPSFVVGGFVFAAAGLPPLASGAGSLLALSLAPRAAPRRK